MKQVLAVAVAALLVAVAIVVRGALDDEGSGDGGGDRDGPADGGLVVACVRELRDACEALGGDVRIEDPAATVAAAADIDAWVTFDPWPAIAELQEGGSVFDGEVVPVASSSLVLVTRGAALPDACAQNPDWVCVAEPGTNGVALPGPDTALGLLVLGHAALNWSAVVRPGEPFARNEFDLPEFDAWRRTIEFVRDPVADMVQFGPAGPVATGTTAATFTTEMQTTREGLNFNAGSTAPAAGIAVVVVGPEAERVAEDEDLLDGLDRLGWTLDTEAATIGVPEPGVLFALQEIA